MEAGVPLLKPQIGEPVQPGPSARPASAAAIYFELLFIENTGGIEVAHAGLDVSYFSQGFPIRARRVTYL